MINPVSYTLPENWGQIRNTNPFSQQLSCENIGLLTDEAFQAPLPLQISSENNLVPQDGFLEAYQVAYPKLQLIALVGTSYEVSLKPSEWISLIIVKSGEVCIVQDGLRWCSTPGRCLIVTGQTLHWSSSAFSVVCLMLPFKEQPRLAETLILEPCEDAQIFSAIVNRQVCIPSRDAIADLLIRHLNSSIEVIAHLHGSDTGLVIHLDLVEHLYKLFSALTSRQCITIPSEIFQESPDIRDSFDDLLEYIEANLHQTLNLSVLERRSNYSRRTLQYAFRNRLGCTATQWIRSCRLEHARQLILMASAEDSVASIALSCGYRSMSLFSIEFQHRFHVKPSHLLRSSQS